MSWSERSIKTRIETTSSELHQWRSHSVEVKDPLKQGLKQIQNYSQLLLYLVEVKDPLKQGLKQKILSKWECT